MQKLRRRPIWAIFAALLTFAAIGCELASQICKAIFDPLPDVWCIAAYAFLGVMLIFNEVVLEKAARDPDLDSTARNLANAQVGTAIALVIALVYSIVFVPAFPLSLVALLFFGMGVGAWSPFINLIVFLCHWRALSQYGHVRSLKSLRAAQLAVGGFAVVMLVCYAVIPMLAGQSVRKVVKNAPAYGMFSTWWGFINGHNADQDGTD